MWIIPPEMFIFGVTIWVYVKFWYYVSIIRYLSYGSSVFTLIGIILFGAMAKEDFEKYKAAKKKEESAQTHYQKKRQPKDGLKFPVTTIEINDHNAKQITTVNYLETDFLTLLATSSVMVFLTIQIINFYNKDSIKDINFAFSLELCVAIFALHYLLKLTFEGGFFKTDESRLSLFFGILALISSFFLLYLIPEHVDLCFPNAYQAIINRINSAFTAIEVTFNIHYKYFCMIVAFIASLISIGQATHAVDFAYYYHYVTREETEKALVRSTKDKSFMHKLNLHITFICPLLIVILYIPALLENYLVPTYIASNFFEFLRTLFVLLYVIMKLIADKDHFQWKMLQSYAYIKALPQNINDQYYTFMNNQLLKRQNQVWTMVLGYVSCAIIPVLMCLLLFHKGIYLLAPEKVESFDFFFLYQNKTETEKANPFELENLTGILKEVNEKGLIPGVFYRGLCGFVIFWWMASYFLISIFTLVYYRRFHRAPVKRN